VTLRLLFDEDVPSGIARALRRRVAGIDLVRVQDAGLRSAPDSEVLVWAAENGRVTLTCDRSTMIDVAVQRVRVGRPMPGLVVVRRDAPTQTVVADLELVVSATRADDWDGQVGFVPI
jgi:predicted nuclease of predicted toxin-antitoxin system